MSAFPKTPLAVFPAIALLVGAAHAQANADGKAIAAAKCNSCHALEARVGNGYTPKGWSTVLRMMSNQGAPISKADIAALHPYLAKTFPEKNKAAAAIVPGPAKVSFKQWPAATPGSRPHDPLAARDGSLWYTGQMANVLGRVDPRTGKVREYKLKTAHSGPHGLKEDAQGNIWYTGNTGALIGKLNPKTGEVTEYPMPDPEAKDPHTLLFAKDGILWFTVQNANRIGRLDPKTGEIKLLTPPTPKSRPYGIVFTKGALWYNESFAKPNTIVRFDPKTEKFQSWAIPGGGDIVRNMSVTADGNPVTANSLVNQVGLVQVK